MFCALKYVVTMRGWSFDLLGRPMIVHLVIPVSMCAKFLSIFEFCQVGVGCVVCHLSIWQGRLLKLRWSWHWVRC